MTPAARRAGAVAVAGAALLVAAASAAATDVAPSELRALAERARTDEAALEQLRRVDSVAGRPADLRSVLAGADDDELDRRLRTLAAGAAARGARPSAAAAREEAREVLEQRRFRRSEDLRPLRGVLEWLGRGVRWALEPVDKLLDRLSGALPGGERTLWTIAAALVAAAAALLARRIIRGRARVAQEQRPRRAGGAVADPRRLEREADAAERRGQLELAVRLRFRAGLLRLDHARRIEFRESMTSGEVARRLRSRDFDRLAATFDEIVYGGRGARSDDVTFARDGWRRVLAEAA